MNNRFRLWLLLIVFAMLAPVGTAMAQRSWRGPPGVLIPPAKQSHRDLPGEIDLSNAEEMMAQRLQDLHELHQLQDQVQGLLADPEFRERLKNQFSPEDLQKIQEKLAAGRGLSGDSNWEKFIKHAAEQQKWDPRQLDIFRSWANRKEQSPPTTSGDGSIQDHSVGGASSPVAGAPGSPSPPMPRPDNAAPEPSLFDRMQESTTKWMMDNLDTVGDNVVEALAEFGPNEANSPLAELVRSLQQPDFSNLNVGERAMGLSSYLSNAGDFLHRQRGAWGEMQSLFHKTPVPSLPHLSGPSVSMPTASAPEGGNWAPALLSLLLLSTIVALLCMRGLALKSRLGSGEDEWRLGSWPVSPGEVSTRQDVIRAFEYLALLCLGPTAGACHHRELADRLAQQDGDNPARRQAADLMAWLYEQARYAPAGEPLSPELISDARHALRLLAGVTAA
ncbi:MAG TPA: hypothetical protein VE999_14750 [Gemmataceae bacterium]|nr:hypothetical protein [Gemmataceae bacterium]